jgi:hypothetical protein
MQKHQRPLSFHIAAYEVQTSLCIETEGSDLKKGSTSQSIETTSNFERNSLAGIYLRRSLEVIQGKAVR